VHPAQDDVERVHDRDPNDRGMIDVVGFDPATPPLIADFARA